MGQLEPGLGKGSFELDRVLQETPGDLAIRRVFLQRD